MLSKWLIPSAGLYRSRSHRYRRLKLSKPARQAKLRMEELESREVPATITVTSLADNTTLDGQVTLREALLAANTDTSVDGSTAGSGADVIVFDELGVFATPQTINVTGDELAIISNLSVTGPGATQLMISRADSNDGDIFEISSAASVTLSGMTIKFGTEGGVGLSSEDGGGIDSSGILAIYNCVLDGSDGNWGEAVNNTGNLTVDSCTITNTGGGIYNSATGTVTIRDSTFTSNVGGNAIFGGNAGSSIMNAGGMVSVSDSTFAGNFTGDIGNDGGTVVVTGSIFSDTNGGGGIWNTGGMLDVDNSTFSNISSGGIRNVSGPATVSGSTFSGNTSGGAISNSGTLVLTDSTFTGNSALEGGAVANDGVMTITSSTFSNNSTDNTLGGSGGGIANAGILTVTNSTFSNNTAVNGNGGGIANNGTLTVTSSTFSGNRASSDFAGDGGGIYGSQFGNVSIVVNNCTFSGNTASHFGGGLAQLPAFGGVLTVCNSTFVGNSAMLGGGIYYSNTFRGKLINDTIVNNSADRGGGLSVSGNLLPSNSIIAGNTALLGTAFGPDVTGGLSSNGHNLIGSVSGYRSGGVTFGTPTVSGGVVLVGVSIAGDLIGLLDAPINPLLAPLGNYGGPTQTMPLLPGSPAFDAGNNALALDGLGNLLPTDQRGLNRFVGTVDIGAVENQSPLPGGDDSDGVSYAVEAGAPNNGDGNNDGLPDSEQINVTSLPNSVSDNYVTLESPTGTSLNSVTPIAPPPANQRAGTGLPKTALLPVGTLDFTVTGLVPAATTQVVLYMPTGTTVNAYYKYNPTTNKWSKFNGAQFVDRNGDGTPDVVLSLTDGGAGDQDGLVNGVIVDPGAPAFVVPIEVQIDVRSSVNLASQGLIAAVVFSSTDFDARLVDASSVRFAGASAVQSSVSDVNGDGLLDLVLNFRTQDTTLRALYEQLLADDINEDGVLDSSHQEASVALTGNTNDNDQFEGSDTVDLFLSGKNLRDMLANLAASGMI